MGRIRIYLVVGLVLIAVSAVFAQELTLLELSGKAIEAKENGNYKEASEWLLQAKLNLEANNDTTSLDYASVCNALGYIYTLNDEIEQSVPEFKKAMEVRSRWLNPEHKDLNESIWLLGKAYYELQNYEQGEIYLLQSFRNRQNSADSVSQAIATNAQRLAWLYHDTDKYDSAERYYEFTDRLFLRYVGENHVLYHDLLKDRVDLYIEMGELDKAQTLASRRLLLVEKLNGNQSVEYGFCLTYMGSIAKQKKQYKESYTHYEGALQLIKAANNTTWVDLSICYNELISLAINDLGKNNDGLRRIEEFKPLLIDEKGKESVEYAELLKDQGIALIHLREFEKSLDVFTQAVEVILLEKNQHETFKFAQYLNNLGYLHNELGNKKETERFYLGAIEVLEYEKLVDTDLYATLHSNLGIYYSELGLIDKAVFHMEAALKVREGLENSNLEGLAATYNNLASVYNRISRNIEARRYFKKSNEIVKTLYGETDERYLSSTLNMISADVRLYGIRSYELEDLMELLEGENLTNTRFYARALYIDGMLASKQQRFQDAIESLSKSLTLLNNLGLNASDDYATIQAELGKNQYLNLDYPEAYNNLKFQYKYEMKSKLETLDYFSGKDKLIIYNNLMWDLRYFFNLSVDYYPEFPEIGGELLEILIKTKGLLFYSNAQIKRIVDASNDNRLKELYAELLEKKESLISLMNSEITMQQKSTAFDSKKEEIDELEKELSTRSTVLKSYFSQTVSWKDLRRSLQENEAIVEVFYLADIMDSDYVLDTYRYVAVVLRGGPESIPEIVEIGSERHLHDQIRYYYNTIDYKVEDNNSYTHFWAPIQNHLENVSRVYFSADGMYHSISLGGLKIPNEDSYLQDKIEIVPVSSSKDILNDIQRDPNTGQVVLMGYPNFNGNSHYELPKTSQDQPVINIDTTSRFFNGENILELPGTLKEVNELEQLFKGAGYSTTSFLQDQATESNIKQTKSPKVLHIATHGISLGYGDEDKLRGVASRQTINQNPLLKSGLLLSNTKNAITKGGEGLLTALEVTGLDLSGTELVVLSACNTGLGEVVNGEGVFGLQRAFLSAGAQAVINSLWAVNDEATQKLMVYFYEYWINEKLSKRQAFYQAQAKLRKEYPHPYYWASFVMIGN